MQCKKKRKEGEILAALAILCVAGAQFRTRMAFMVGEPIKATGPTRVLAYSFATKLKPSLSLSLSKLSVLHSNKAALLEMRGT